VKNIGFISFVGDQCVSNITAIPIEFY